MALLRPCMATFSQNSAGRVKKKMIKWSVCQNKCKCVRIRLIFNDLESFSYLSEVANANFT